MKLFRISAFLVLLVCLFTTTPILASDDGNILERVADASASFVEHFNEKNATALGRLYTRNGTLKLPGALALSGRGRVVAAWQQGFDNGLDSLVLSVESLQRVGARKVLENGTYALTIQTPDGPIVQIGTFSVLWRVPQDPEATPRIIFDSIDAD